MTPTSYWKSVASRTSRPSKTLTGGLLSRCQYAVLLLAYITETRGGKMGTSRANIDLHRRNDVEQKPNLLVRLMREPQWSQQHPEIMGPNTSFMYFGPEKSSGYLIYGNGPNQPMNSSVRQKKGMAKYALFSSPQADRSV